MDIGAGYNASKQDSKQRELGKHLFSTWRGSRVRFDLFDTNKSIDENLN